MFGVGGEGGLVFRLQLEDRVQVDGRLFAIAETIPVERRQLQHDAHPRLGLRHGPELTFSQLGELRVIPTGEIELDELFGSRAPGRFQQRDLVVDALRFDPVVELSFGELRPLVEEVDALALVVRRPRDALAVVAIELLVSPRLVVDPLEELGRFRVPRHHGQGLSQGGDGVVDVAGLLPTSRHLMIDGRRAVCPVGADPIGVGVHRRQQVQRLFVPGSQPDHLGQALGRGVELFELFGEHPTEAEEQVGPAARFRGAFELQLVEPHHPPPVAEGPVDLPRRFDRADVLLGELSLFLGAANRPFQSGEMVQEQLAHLRFQLRHAARVAGASDRRRFHLQHRHVVGGAALLAIDVLEAGRRSDVGRVTVNGVDQVGLRPFGVPQLV